MGPRIESALLASIKAEAVYSREIRVWFVADSNKNIAAGIASFELWIEVDKHWYKCPGVLNCGKRFCSAPGSPMIYACRTEFLHSGGACPLGRTFP
jgi:hypothetical protein